METDKNGCAALSVTLRNVAGAVCGLGKGGTTLLSEELWANTENVRIIKALCLHIGTDPRKIASKVRTLTIPKQKCIADFL